MVLRDPVAMPSATERPEDLELLVGKVSAGDPTAGGDKVEKNDPTKRAKLQGSA